VDRDTRVGMTLLELVVVLAMIGALLAFAGSTVSGWSKDQRAATSARSVADAFNLARAEAIRTGSNFIVAFRIEPGLGGVTSDIVIANDGPPGTSDCTIAASEIVESASLEQDVRFGTSPGLSNGTAAPNDSGASGHQSIGSSFTDGTNPAAAASWVMFFADGLPRRFTDPGAPPCTAIGPVGAGGGAIYVTNGRRDYAVVLSPLGVSRVHRWNTSAGAWTQ